MVADTDVKPWFEFRIHDADTTRGVDTRVLSRFLAELTVAMRAIADDRLGIGERRGPMTADERAIAAIRVTAVRPGSIALQFAEPPTSELQSDLLSQRVTPDDAMGEFISLCQSATGEYPQTELSRPYRAVTDVLRTAARIGSSATLTHRNKHGQETHASIPLEQDWIPVPSDQITDIQQRTIIGHVYMVDIELGRQRLRVKLPDESDLTLDVDEVLLGEIGEAIDQLAELHVSEASVDGRIVERVVGSYILLPARERASLSPPKSLLEIARERGFLLRPPPDYRELASAVWETEGEVEDFGEYISTVRSKSA